MTTKYQCKNYGPKPFHGGTITATVRHDDSCRNGHNTFSITGTLASPKGKVTAGGCLHTEIAEAFPELKPYLKWHLMSTDGPLHYVENTLYWLGWRNCKTPNLEYARNSAVWPDLPQEFMNPNPSGSICGPWETPDHIKKALLDRLGPLLEEFKRDVQALNLEY